MKEPGVKLTWTVVRFEARWRSYDLAVIRYNPGEIANPKLPWGYIVQSRNRELAGHEYAYDTAFASPEAAMISAEMRARRFFATKIEAAKARKARAKRLSHRRE
jgi:hypothetical protein